jgi:methionine synthase II (cobalamin-independent)
MSEETDSNRRDYHFTCTGIGSAPGLDVQGTCREILNRFPEAPFWPQFPRRSPVEDMTLQYIEGISLLEADPDGRRPLLTSLDTAAQLADLYEHVLSEDAAHFSISREYAPGLHELIGLLRQQGKPCGNYIKGQTVGPVTLALAARDQEGKALIHSPEWTEALTQALALKALWQVRELAATGREPILFLDEPSLSGFGSAFSPLERAEVIRILGSFMAFLRERTPAVMGIHCCGNTDWSMLLEAGPDIINFDAFGYLDTFLLYRADILRFLERGGSIAWGIVPTSDEDLKRVSLEDLLERLQAGLFRLGEWGLDANTIRRRSFLTPACGMGNLQESSASRALALLSELSGRCAGEC